MTDRSGQQQHASEVVLNNQKLLERRMVEVRMSVESAASDLISAKKPSCELSLRLRKGGEDGIMRDRQEYGSQ